MFRTTPVIDAGHVLGARSGLPDDLCVLLERYPRECWQAHRNLGEMAQFWLSRHEMFRELAGQLTSGTDRFLGGGEPREFAGWFAPSLQFLLSHLATHHQIEDHHYFPKFQAADERLARGFDLLENDHHVIHAAMARAVEAANAFLGAVKRGSTDLRTLGKDYAAAGGPMMGLLLSHLDDEEDLIVPLILDRGEEALGVGH